MTSHELRTLRALTARLVPGPPEDPDPGALDAGAAEAIDRLLCAFTDEDPPIHAAVEGGFVPLDSTAELGWRIRLEGSQGQPGREFGGVVEGLAQRVSRGLSLLDRRCRCAHGVDFADAAVEAQDALLDAADEQLASFVHLALMLTLDVVYGPPQYGGNGAAYRAIGWPGFTQPRGFTRAEVSEPDGPAGTSRNAMRELRSTLSEDAGWRSDSR